MSSPKSPPTPSPSARAVPEIFYQHHWESLLPTLRNWSERKKIPQVLLLSGPAGVGKNTLAHLIARWTFCEQGSFARDARDARNAESANEGADLFGGGSPAPSEAPAFLARPCGACSACKKADAGACVDLTEIGPDPEDATPTLKIEAFRDLQRSLGFSPNEAPYRIVLIRDCDRMTPQAANAMLKTLEEPPAHVLFFLTASEPEMVLPTLRSRCQVLRLKPFHDSQIRELLAHSPAPSTPDRRELAARLSQGSWGRALKLMDSNIWEAREKLLLFLRKPGQSYSDVVEWAAKDSESALILFDLLEHLTSDLMRNQSHSPNPKVDAPWENSDAALTLSQHADLVRNHHGGADGAIHFWGNRAERLSQARREALTPMNRKLLIQDVLAPWITVNQASPK